MCQSHTATRVEATILGRQRLGGLGFKASPGKKQDSGSKMKSGVVVYIRESQPLRRRIKVQSQPGKKQDPI
jgi:hypothetical protein